ncbi:MAG: PQQ-binding-like beta-propeller repeat protein [Anaerolineales bacterium]
MKKPLILLFSILLLGLIIPEDSPAQSSADWYMAGANPERTSWVSEEVSGDLSVDWYRPIEAYIGAKVQLIAANNMIYVSTARGVYALDADSGDLNWRYDTQMPVGHSPTVVGDTLYVGGFDKKVHAINALTGQRKWVFEGSLAGFDTNPVVVNHRVYLGGRDGYFYALNAMNGNLVWRYPAAGQDPIGPITFSAAYTGNTLYFAANDNYAYALNASNGSLVWKHKLGGHSYQGYWPVIYQDKVIFPTEPGYRIASPGTQSFCCDEYYGGPCEDYTNCVERDEFSSSTNSQLLGPVSENAGVTGYPAGVQAIDLSGVVNYFNQKPWRKNTYILNRSDGSEYDIPLPVLHWQAKNGNVYPPIIDPNNGRLYINAWYEKDHISRGMVMGWDLGSNWMTMDGGGESAVDEPQAISGGGNIIYSNSCCDRQGQGRDLSTGINQKYWTYYSAPDGVSWSSLERDAPGYDEMWVYSSRENSGLWGWYGGQDQSLNGIYHSHGYQAPIIPYQGKLFVHRSNAIIAFSPTGGGMEKDLLTINPVTDQVKMPSNAELTSRLEFEIQKIVSAGQLRSGYHNDGYLPGSLRQLEDYYAIPGDTLYTLSDAYFQIQDPRLKSQLKSYLLDFYNTYFGETMYTNLGWEGAQREAMVIPDDLQDDLESVGKNTSNGGWPWSYPPQNIYAMWKFARVFPEKKSEIYAKAKFYLPDSYHTDDDETWINHAYMQGYIGFLNLYKMVGSPRSDSRLAGEAQSNLNNLYLNRISHFSIESPWTSGSNYKPFSVSRNFIFLVPEIGDQLSKRIKSDVQSAMDEYDYVVPYWMANAYEASSPERSIQVLYDPPALFQAKAYILKESQEELFRYLDTPFFIRGDLYYIQNLIATIRAGAGGPAKSPDMTPTPRPCSIGC